LTPQEFIDKVSPIAKRLAPTSNVPASFTVAQSALESAWGKRALGNNLFGIKADESWHGPTIAFDTHEVINGKEVPKKLLFRAYPDWESSIKDHAIFLKTNPRYKNAFQFKNGDDFATAIGGDHYASDPHYAAKIIGIIDVHNLSTLDA
jgi:flagellum-specific peptidoglycan hydrolase FlgJ